MELHLQSVMNETAEAEPKFRIFEFDGVEDVKWMQKNWTLSIYAIVIYLNLIYFGQILMKNRKPFNLRKLLVVWNLALAVFSMKAFSTAIFEGLEVLSSPGGFHKSICQPWSELSTTGRYYGWLFTISKIVELGDTAFLVLRKKNVIFLHWYHHVSVMLFSWYAYQDEPSTSPWFMLANVFVHSFMYSYYALVAMRIKIPRRIAMSITCLQIVQMIVGLTVNAHALNMKRHNIDCAIPTHHIFLCIGMYASYFILFSNFFVNVYFKKGGKREKIE